MPIPSWPPPRRARALAAAGLLLAAACNDGALPPAAPAAPSFAAAPLRGVDTSYLPAARVRARLLAIALAGPPARARLRDALRRSPLATHRIALERAAGTGQGADLLRDVARAAGVADDSVRRLFADGPALDLMLPRAADRRRWRPAAPLAVGVADRRRASPHVVYFASGDSSVSGETPGSAWLVLTPAGDRSRRVGAQPDAPGDAVEDAGDGTLSGTLTWVTADGDSGHVDVADLIPNYREVSIDAPPPEHDRALAALRAARASRRAPADTGIRRLVECFDTCEPGAGGPLGGWTDTTYLVGFYEKGDPEFGGGDATYEPWYDGYYRGTRWRLQFDGVTQGAALYVDLPFMNARPADHSSEYVRVIGGEDQGSWSDDACTWPGMTFAGARYNRSWAAPTPVTLVGREQYVWHHCGGYTDADKWGAMLRWSQKARPPVASLRVEFDTTYMSAVFSSVPWLYPVPQYQGAFRYAYSGCPSVYYLVGTTANGERLDSTSLAVLANVTSSAPTIADVSRPSTGILRNYARGTVTLTATIDGISAQRTYAVNQYVTGIAITPTPRGLTVGNTALESIVWNGASGDVCAMLYRRARALRPTWSAGSPSLAVVPKAPDTSAVYVTPSAVGTFTLSAALGPMTASASIVSETALTTAPALHGTFTTSGALLSWTAVSGARAYDVYRRVDGGAWQYYASTAATSWQDNTLVDFSYSGPSPGTAGTEDFRVAATNYAGSGPTSNVVGFKLASASGGGDSGSGGSGSGDGGGAYVTSRAKPAVKIRP